MDKKLICVTGIDGTGKSTLIKGILNHYAVFYHASIWDLMTSDAKCLPFKSKLEIDEFLCSLTPDSRLLFLAHCMKYSLDKALDSQKNTILIDSYYYKYFATEKALGANEKLIQSLEHSLPKPNVVIELLLSVELAAQRKKKYSRYECGLDLNPGVSSFVNFQKAALIEWKRFNRTKWFKIDAQQLPGQLLEKTLQIIS